MVVEIMGNVIKSKQVKSIDTDDYFTITLMKVCENNFEVVTTCTNVIEGKEFNPVLLKFYDNVSSEKEAEELYKKEIETSTIIEK